MKAIPLLNRHRTICLLILMLVAVAIPLRSQQIKFEHLNTRNGLSHNSVLSILQDSRGFMWFGTYGGLNKYDGYKITTYKSEYREKNSLKANAIVAIYEDRDKMIWLGTYGGGVIRFDPRKETFTQFTHLFVDESSSVIPNVKQIYEDDSGVLWLASSEVVCKQ
jgi:ligand-binding sensor domain-containing protein